MFKYKITVCVRAYRKKNKEPYYMLLRQGHETSINILVKY